MRNQVVREPVPLPCIPHTHPDCILLVPTHFNETLELSWPEQFASSPQRRLQRSLAWGGCSQLNHEGHLLRLAAKVSRRTQT